MFPKQQYSSRNPNSPARADVMGFFPADLKTYRFRSGARREAAGAVVLNVRLHDLLFMLLWNAHINFLTIVLIFGKNLEYPW